MPPEPSVTSAEFDPLSWTLRYPSALLLKSCERAGPKSVRPAMNCAGVAVVVCLKCRVDIRTPHLALRSSRSSRAAAGRLLKKREQIAVDLIGERSAHSVGSARIHLQRGVLNDFR